MEHGVEKVIERVFALAAEDERARLLAADLQALNEAGRWGAQAIGRLADERVFHLVEDDG